MSYAALADLQQWIDNDIMIQLTDDADAGSVDTGVVATALEAASVEIDGYLGSRYALPLADPPAILGKLCVDISGYLLYIRRDAGAPEHWQARYKNAVAFLIKIASGQISLGAGDPSGTGGRAAPEFVGPGRIFDRDKLTSF